MAAIAPPAPASDALLAGPPRRAILKLALPTVAAMLTQSVVNEIDIVFFAHLPAQEASNAQAALLPSLIILWLFGGSLSSISVGTQAYTGRRFAEGRYDDAGRVLTNAVIFSLVAGVIFTIIGFVTMPHILGAIIQVPEAREAALAYLDYRLIGITSMVATFAFKAFFDGIGKTHIHLVSAVVMNALNIVLCLLLIFGNDALGIPKMGIAGAGLAGCIATYVGLFIMVGYALKPEYRARFTPFKKSQLDIPLMRSLVKLSVPSAVATIAVMTGFALFSAIAGKLDQLALEVYQTGAAAAEAFVPYHGAATTVIVGVLKLTFTACLAFGTSTATLVAQSLGIRDGEKAARFGWTSVRLGMVIFGAIGLLEFVFADQILAFATQSEVVREAALIPMRMMALLSPIIAVGMILTQALFGAGNTRFVMVVELILHFTCLVPLAWLLSITLRFDLVGLWSAGACYVVLLALVMSYKFRKGDWKSIAL